MDSSFAAERGPKFETLGIAIDEQIATITLQRPERLNAFNRTMASELIRAMDYTDSNDQIRAVIVTGEGRGFCAGADLQNGDNTFIRQAMPYSDEQVRDPGGLVTLRIYQSLKPIIAAVNGPAIGIGATMILPMDVRIASESAKFGLVFSRLGLVPEAASSYFLPRLVGIEKSLEWCYKGHVFSATEALNGNLISEVTADDRLLARAKEIARSFTADSAPVSIALTRQMLWRGLGMSHPMEAHRVDSRGIHVRGSTEDVKEGIKAFRERRSPSFPNSVSRDMPDYYPWWDEPEYQ